MIVLNYTIYTNRLPILPTQIIYTKVTHTNGFRLIKITLTTTVTNRNVWHIIPNHYTFLLLQLRTLFRFGNVTPFAPHVRMCSKKDRSKFVILILPVALFTTFRGIACFVCEGKIFIKSRAKRCEWKCGMPRDSWKIDVANRIRGAISGW